MHDTPLTTLLARWEDARRTGKDLTAADLCHDCPERAAEVAPLLDALRRVAPLLDASDDQATLAPPAFNSAATLAPAPWPLYVPPAAAGPTGPPGIPGYDIEGELGRGGMGVVYRARQKGLNRPVALKMVLAAGHAGPDERDRFRAEAEAVAALQHPNIVQVFEVGEHLGQPFFSLELCALGSLEKKLNGTPLPVREAAALLRVLARAMQAAHDAGVVHRDLKPANVLLAAGEGASSESGSSVNATVTQAPGAVPKITDFGLAKRVGADSGQTRTGAIVGTPSYMAPEQAEGKKDVGPPADIYALGAILYECLTGRPPFKAATPLDTVMQVVSDDPAPPRQLNPLVPHDLETICLKCLQKEPARRYASAGALADDLGRFLADEPIHARPVTILERGVKWVRRRPAIAGLLALVIVLTGLGVGLVLQQWWRAEHQRELAEEQKGVAEAASRDAANRAEAEAKARGEAEAAQQLAGARLTQTEEARKLADDRLGQANDALRDARENLYFYRLMRAERELQARRLDRAAGWLDECPLDVRGWEWAHLKRQARPEAVRCAGAFSGTWAVAWSPDGATLVSGGPDRVLRVWEPKTGRERRLVDPKGAIGGVAFSPDGGTLATVTLQINTTLMQFNASWENAISGEVKLYDTKSWTAKGAALTGIGCVAFSPDGTRFAAGNRREVRLYDAKTSKLLHTLSGHKAYVNRLTFSPDGTRLAAGVADLNALPLDAWQSPAALKVPGEAKLWDVAEGKDVTPKWPAPAGGVTALAYLPDGQRLASLGLDGSLEVWDIAEGKRLHHLRGHEARTEGLCLLPDGKILTTGLDARAVVWDLATGAKVRTHDGPDRSCAVTGDGRWLACAAGEGQPVRIYDLHDRGARDLPIGAKVGGLVAAVAFSPDGRRVYALSRPPRRMSQLHAFDAATGRELYVVNSRGNRLAVTPDGQHVITGGRGALLQPNELSVRDAATGKEVRSLGGKHTQEIVSVAVSADGLWLASTGCTVTDILRAGEVCIWDLKAGKLLCPPIKRGVRGHIHSVAISPDGKLVAGASVDQTVHLFDRATGKPAGQLRGASRSLNAVAFRPGGGQLAAGTVDGAILVWDLKTGELLREMQGRLGNGAGETGSIGTLAYTADGRRLLSASFLNNRGEVKLWDIDTGAELLTLPGWLAVAASPDGRRIAAGATDGAQPVVRLWDTPREGELRVVRGHGGAVRYIAVSPDGLRFASGGDDGLIRIWEARTGEVWRTLKGHAPRVWAVSFSPDGKRLASVGDEIVRIWDLESGKQLRELKGHKGDVRAVAWLAGDRVASGGFDATMRLWDVAGDKPPRVVSHGYRIFSLTASPDGRQVASGADRLRVWDGATGEKQLELDEAPTVVAAAWSPDGRKIATADGDRRLRVWDAGTGALAVDFGPFVGHHWALSWGQKGRLLAAVGDDRVVAVFDTLTGKEAGTYSGSPLWGAGVGCLANGLVAAGDALGTLRFFRLPPPTEGPATKPPDYPPNESYLARTTREEHRAGRHAEALAWARKWHERAVWKKGMPEADCLGIEALALHALKRDAEAVKVLARLRELMRNDWCRDYPASSRVYKEAAGKIALPAVPEEEEAIRKAVVAAEVAGWVKNDHDTYLALRLPSVKAIDGRGPTPGPHDITRDRDGLRFWIKCWRSGQPSTYLRTTIEVNEVKLSGGTAEVRLRNTLHWQSGFYSSALALSMEKGPGGWKIARQRNWAAARRNGETRLVYDEAFLRALDAVVDAARKGNDPRALRQALMEARRWPEAYAVAKQITEGKGVTASDWAQRAEAALEAADAADVIASAKRARERDSKFALSNQLQGALKQAAK